MASGRLAGGMIGTVVRPVMHRDTAMTRRQPARGTERRADERSTRFAGRASVGLRAVAAEPRLS